MTDERDESLEKRMDKLEAELADKRRAEKKKTAAAKGDTASGYSQAVKISSEFISAVVVGAMLGYLIDWLVGTHPWGMIVMLLLGFVAGVMNVLRTTGTVKSPHPVDRLGEMNKKTFDDEQD